MELSDASAQGSWTQCRREGGHARELTGPHDDDPMVSHPPLRPPDSKDLDACRPGDDEVGMCAFVRQVREEGGRAVSHTRWPQDLIGL